MKRVILFLFVVTASVLVLAGCGKEEEKNTASTDNIVVEDSLNRKVEFKEKPKRIVVTSASFLEPLESVGGASLVVGRPDSRTKMPEFAKGISSVGKVYQIDTEKVLAAKPDLVIINKGMNEKLASILESSGVKTLVLDLKSYDDVKKMVAVFADVVGNPQKGQEIAQKMDGDIAALKEKIPKEKRRVSIIHSTNQGLTVELEGSIAGSVAAMLGWENVAAGLKPLEKNPDAAPYSLETLAEQNPEIIFVTSMGKLDEIKTAMEKTMEEPAWQTITAVREKRVYYLPQDLFLLSPGIRYPEAVKKMAECVYPHLK